MKKGTKEPISKKEEQRSPLGFVKKVVRNSEENIDEEENEEREPFWRERAERIGKLFVGIIVIVAVIALLNAFLFGASYNGYEIVEETSVKNSSVVDYVSYQNSLLKFSKDGATYVDEKGNAIWNETFAMKMPRADVSGDYVAIADMNGNDVYIFNKEGKVGSTSMPYKICDIAVAGQGEFAVILEGEMENYINIYDKNGEQISEIQTTLDKSGYPMDVDLSEDGEKLFSSYLTIDGGQAKYSLAAYNFGSVGQNENADRLMGGYQLEDTVVPKVEFLDNNTICAFGDNRIIIYSMRQKPSEKAVIAFEGEVRSVIYSSEYVGIIVPNTDDDGKNNEAPYILELYNTSGRKVMSKKIDFEYNNVKMSKDEVIFTGGTECRIYTVKGKLKFSYAFQKNVTNIVPTGYSRRYIVIYDSGSEIIRLKHQSEKE